MPNRPTYPRIALPPALALRVDALRAQAPTGRPSRQAVVERALAVGLGVLEAPLAHIGEAPARAALSALCEDLEALARGVEDRWRGAYAEALRLARRRAGEAMAGRGGVDGAADAPTGSPAPALARRLARQARAVGLDAKARDGVVTVRAPTTGFDAFVPAPNDPRWGVDAAGNHYARESHTIGAMAPNGRRVEVAVCAGDTVAIVGQALAAAWQARDGLAGNGKA